jgi:hypothetical protein
MENKSSSAAQCGRPVKKKLLTPSVFGIKKIARLSATNRNALLRALKQGKRKKPHKEGILKSKSSGKQGTSLSTGSGTGAKYLKSQDWKSWVALHGDSKQVKDDVAELGENIGVKCSNSFQALARGRGSGSSKGRVKGK